MDTHTIDKLRKEVSKYCRIDKEGEIGKAYFFTIDTSFGLVDYEGIQSIPSAFFITKEEIYFKSIKQTSV